MPWSASSLEELDGALVLLGRGAGLEGPQVAPPSGLGVDLARVKTVTAGGELPDHAASMLATLALFPVEAMQNPVHDGREEHARDHDEDQAAVEGVAAREHLAAVGERWIDRPHAAEQHRRVHERVAPGHALEIRVS